MLVSADEISTAVFDLSNGKSVGFDGLSAEHLKYAGDAIYWPFCLLLCSYMELYLRTWLNLYWFLLLRVRQRV